MTETKIEIQQRKIRNGIRKQKEREQKAIWEKLSLVDHQPWPGGNSSMTISRQAVTAKTRKIKAGYVWNPDEILPIQGEN